VRRVVDLDHRAGRLVDEVDGSSRFSRDGVQDRDVALQRA
jgi:hypothetical protein